MNITLENIAFEILYLVILIIVISIIFLIFNKMLYNKFILTDLSPFVYLNKNKLNSRKIATKQKSFSIRNIIMISIASFIPHIIKKYKKISNNNKTDNSDNKTKDNKSILDVIILFLVIFILMSIISYIIIKLGLYFIKMPMKTNYWINILIYSFAFTIGSVYYTILEYYKIV